jgi:hypothetical protein
MAFTVPTFNLLCDVYSGPWPTKSLRISDLPCNLAAARPAKSTAVENEGELWINGYMTLLVPALTDLRMLGQGVQNDILEVPAGTGRWYQLNFVDDVGKGFSNEHRMALLVQIAEPLLPSQFPGLFWPIPMP